MRGDGPAPVEMFTKRLDVLRKDSILTTQRSGNCRQERPATERKRGDR